MIFINRTISTKKAPISSYFVYEHITRIYKRSIYNYYENKLGYFEYYEFVPDKIYIYVNIKFETPIIWEQQS